MTHRRYINHLMDASSRQMQDALILLMILSQSDAEYREGHWKSPEDVEADFEKEISD